MRSLFRTLFPRAAVEKAFQPMDPPGDGWIYYMACFPPTGELVELWRHEWGNETSFATAGRDLRPEFNVAGLYWRPA